MKIAIVSDTHGIWQPLVAEIQKQGAEYLFFLGDVAQDGYQLAEALAIPLAVVRGNCDNYTEKAPLELEGIRFYLCHGHRYQVKEGLENLYFRALSVEAQVVCFGHSHVAYYEEGDDVIMLNPGSASRPRNYGDKSSWGLLETGISEKTGEFAIKYTKKDLPN